MKAGFFRPGIGAQPLAAEHLGWSVDFIYASDPITERILKHHFPNSEVSCKVISNHEVEIISGCTPSPPVSNAKYGQDLERNSLELALFFIELATKLGSRWLVWECGTKALAFRQGQFFSKILDHLRKNGYGFAWRVMDAQHFGVPQTRRSLYLVGYLGDWRPPIAVLFDREETSISHSSDRTKSRYVSEVEGLSEASDFILYTQTPEARIYPKSPKLNAETPRWDTHHFSENPYVVVSPTINQVRDLTPVEYLRLQGFADDYLENISGQVQPFGVNMCYGLCGASSCTPTYLWLYHRIQQVQDIINETRST